MFAATITPSDLQTAFEPVSALVDECKVQITENGVTVTAVDPANVGMVDLTVPAETFDTFEADRHTIGVPLERFLDIISLFTDEDEPARIKLNEESRKLRLESGGLDYTLSLIDPDSIRQEPDMPDLDLPASVTAPGEEFSRAVTACNMVADYLRVGANPDGEFYVYAKGDTDTVNVTVDNEEVIDADLADAESLFSIEYLRKMEKPMPSGTPVTFSIGSEFPLIINFELVDEAATVEYVLAPRIQSE